MACDTCYQRKLRYDSVNRAACSRYKQANVSCVFAIGDERRKDSRIKRRAASRYRHKPSPVKNPGDAAAHKQQSTVSKDTQSQETQETEQPYLPNGKDEHLSTVIITTPEECVEKDMARTALDDFFTRNMINSDTWRIPGHQVRSIYAGSTICNLSHLISDEANDISSRFLHFSFPNIRPVVPWGPSQQLGALKLLSPSATRDISAFPAQDVRDDLIEAYFTQIHPGFPIVDEAEFRYRYNDRANPPPLLLFQSILLAGSHVCEHPKVAQNRAVVQATFFRRAKTLFNHRYENDRTHMVEAALLFCWHFEGADDASANEYYLVGVASRMTAAMGMHRALSAGVPSRVPPALKRIYRRLWWTIVQFDTLSSLHHGYPMIVDLQESDQPMLCADDFVSSDAAAFPSKISSGYCIQSASLCVLLASALKPMSPGSLARARKDPDAMMVKKKNLVARLVHWSIPVFGGAGGTGGVADRPLSFWTLQLSLHYHMILLHLHRMPHDHNSRNARRLPSREDAEICRLESVRMEYRLECIAHQKLLKQCWFSVQTAVLAIAIQLEREIMLSRAARAFLLHVQARERLARLFPIMAELSASWPAIDAVLRRFQRLFNQTQMQMLPSEVDAAQSPCGYESDSDSSLGKAHSTANPPSPNCISNDNGNKDSNKSSDADAAMPVSYTEYELRDMFEGYDLATYPDPEFLSSENLWAENLQTTQTWMP